MAGVAVGHDGLVGFRRIGGGPFQHFLRRQGRRVAAREEGAVRNVAGALDRACGLGELVLLLAAILLGGTRVDQRRSVAALERDADVLARDRPFVGQAGGHLRRLGARPVSGQRQPGLPPFGEPAVEDRDLLETGGFQRPVDAGRRAEIGLIRAFIDDHDRRARLEPRRGEPRAQRLVGQPQTRILLRAAPAAIGRVHRAGDVAGGVVRGDLSLLVRLARLGGADVDDVDLALGGERLKFGGAEELAPLGLGGRGRCERGEKRAGGEKAAGHGEFSIHERHGRGDTPLAP